MFGKKEADKDVKAFEARLAALRPRADRLDAGWRALLEKEAALTLTLSQRERGLEDASFRRERGRCADPAGHRFVCVHCGTEATGAARRRWPWPAAFSAMTCAAAVLLVMLVTQRPPSGARAVSLSGVENLAGPASSGAAPTVPFNLGRAASDRAGEDTMPYLCLRNQVLRDGVESWSSPVSTVVTAAKATEAPLSYREQLNRLLEQQGLRGS